MDRGGQCLDRRHREPRDPRHRSPPRGRSARSPGRAGRAATATAGRPTSARLDRPHGVAVGPGRHVLDRRHPQPPHPAGLAGTRTWKGSQDRRCADTIVDRRSSLRRDLRVRASMMKTLHETPHSQAESTLRSLPSSPIPGSGAATPRRSSGRYWPSGQCDWPRRPTRSTWTTAIG